MSSFFRHGFSGPRPQISRPTNINAPFAEISPTFVASGWTQEVDPNALQARRPDPVPQQTPQAAHEATTPATAPAAPRGPRFPYSPRLQALVGRAGAAQNDASRSHINFAALRRSDSQDSTSEEARDRIEELSPSREVGSPDGEKGFGRRMTGTNSLSGKSEFSFVQKSEGVSVSHLLPTVTEDRHKKQNFWRATYGLCIIIGGWLLILFVCYLFKGLALQRNLAASNSTAEFMKKHPTTAVQLFTVIGVFCSEICMILWGYALSYFAIRRLAFGKERTELLTYAALAESKRAGYTLSRRKLSWPATTLAIWLGATFLAPAFTTLITPTAMNQFRDANWLELDHLSANLSHHVLSAGGPEDTTRLFRANSTGGVWLNRESTLPCSFDKPYNTATISVTDKNGTRVGSYINCPQYNDINTLLSAGMAKLQRTLGYPNPNFRMANTTFNGGTGGVLPLGPNGASISGEALNVPDTISRPKGYDYEYTTHQQGASAEVKCKSRPKGTEIANITWFDTLGAVRIDYTCGPASLYEIIYAGSASVAPVLCPEINQDVYDADPSDSSFSDPDYTTLHLIDIARQPQYGPALRETLLQQGNGDDGNLNSVLGGDISCTMRHTWSDREVRYSSPSDTFTVEDGPGANVTYITGIDHELLARDLSQYERVDVLSNGTATDDEYRWFSRQWQSDASYNAALSVFQMSERLGPPAVSPPGYPANQTFGSTETGQVAFSYLPGQNNAVLHVWQFDLEQKPNADNTTQKFEVAHLEPFIQGVIEYAQTAQRQTFAYELSDPETRNLGWYGPEWHATRNIPGVWNASTVGWGNGEQGETESSTIVYASLTPLLVFAALSFALVAWSHYYDRPNGTPYLAECDPIDFVDAVIASSQGGLQNSFHRDALLKEHGSLHGARAVKVRLGQIYRKDDPDGLPKLGFVDVN